MTAPEARLRRRFVAVGVDPLVRDALDRLIGPVRRRRPDLAWTDPRGWHVTLAFLGEVADARVTEVVGVVHGACDGGVLPHRLTVGAAQWFGNALVLGVVDDPPGAVAELGGRVQHGLEAAGLPVHVRDVRPHLTLARHRRGGHADDAPIADVDAAVTRGSALPDWTVTAVGVWATRPRQGPAHYAVDAEVPLPS